MFGNRNCCNSERQNMGFGMGYGMNQPMMGQGFVEQQVIEPTITKCVEQEFYHEVPQE